MMAGPCAGCDMAHLPVCAGEVDHAQCSAAPAERSRRSLFAATLAGWPAVSRCPEAPHAAAIDPGALASPGRPPAATPRRIDRSKPRMALGEPQRPPAGCGPCAAKAAAG
jgi:hypothetical protein